MVNRVITFGTRNSSSVPISMQKQENSRLRTGMRVLRDRMRNCQCACFSTDRPYSMRVLEKTPLLAEDIAEVSATKLITAAAAGSPALANSVTKGLVSADTPGHEATAMITTIDSR